MPSPPKRELYDQGINLKVSRRIKRAIQKAARIAGLPASTWMRDTLETNARIVAAFDRAGAPPARKPMRPPQSMPGK